MTEKVSSFGNWELKQRLGEGGFGEVLLWKCRSKHQFIATKQLKENNQLSADEKFKLKQRWEQEYKWMRNLNTSYIVRGIDVDDEAFVKYLNENHVWRPLPVIIMEYCNGGDLRSHLENIENMNGLHEFEVRAVLRALRYAVEYLHTQCKIEHRDIKPDNIVIHQEGNERIYKLTDFGFARKTTENTVLKSVVGTRHYFAPEVVDTAKYTYTVDYWSVGVIAFELICGVTPFIPHQDLYNIITQIKRKPKSCIAITEDPDNSNKFVHKEKLFSENRMSSVFLSKIEQWLCLALDTDYKTRGSYTVETGKIQKDTNEFYSSLDSILETKILTVFCLSTYQFYSYEITPDHYDTLVFESDFIDKLVEWSGLSREHLFLVLPLLHPVQILKQNSKLIDLFVENWQDTSNNFNPPVMLYVLGYHCEYNYSDPYISDIIKNYINRDNIEEKVGKWIIPQLERHVHYLLQREQRYLETFIAGLHQYLLTIENYIFNYEKILLAFLDEMLRICGCVRQFHRMICAAKKIYELKIPGSGGFFLSWLSKAEEFKNEINKLYINIGMPLKKRYNSALRRTREETENSFYDEYPKKDIFSLKTFRKFIKEGRQNANLLSRLNICQKAIYNCLENRQNFLNYTKLKKSEDLINEVHMEYQKILEIVKNSESYLLQFEMNITNETENFHMELLNIKMDNGGKRLEADVCALNIEKIQSSTNSPMHSVLNELLNSNSELLIEEAMRNLQLIERELDEK